MSLQPLTFCPASLAACDTAVTFAANVPAWAPPSISAVCNPTVPPITLDRAAENVCAFPPPAFSVALNPWAASAVAANCLRRFPWIAGSDWSSVRHALPLVAPSRYACAAPRSDGGIAAISWFADCAASFDWFRDFSRTVPAGPMCWRIAVSTVPIAPVRPSLPRFLDSPTELMPSCCISWVCTLLGF